VKGELNMNGYFIKTLSTWLALLIAVGFATVRTENCMAQPSPTPAPHRTDWFHKAKWGVFCHYLSDVILKDAPPGSPSEPMTVEKWNQLIANFDVEGLADQLKSCNAGYFCLTLGQNSGYYLSPNATYDKLAGYSPSHLSRRDLIPDLSAALAKRGIPLMVYLPSGAPDRDPLAREKLQWKSGNFRLAEFQRMWEAVIREWSLRWGAKIKGWWIDGCYYADAMYRHPDEPNFTSFAAALRAGNPDAIIAFNPGVTPVLRRHAPDEDYTAGEANEPLGMQIASRWVDGAQAHVLSYLGNSWWYGVKPRFSNEQVVQWMRDFLDTGGVVTWDVHVQPNGLIPEAMMAQLKAIDKGLRAPAPPRVSIPPGNLATRRRAMLLDITGGKPLPPNRDNRFASLGVDGDPATVAQGSMEWPWTYQVDLGEVTELKRVVITFGEFYATDYEVVLSPDGKEWKSVAHATGAKGGKVEHSFPPVAARYVRIKGLKPDGPNQPGGQMSIAELEVYR
jgi:hypothetical protein